MTDHLSRPTAADFYARNRGGCLFTTSVNQRIGSYLCVPAYRAGLTPTVLTLANLTAGLTAAIVVGMAGAGTSAPHRIVAAVAGFLLWQLAYSLDCADGQLARYTGRTSSAGARLDVLCDVAVQISLVSALAAVAEAQVPETPAWLLAAFAGTWMVNLITSVLQSGEKAASLITSRSMPVRVVKLVRDYGAVIALAGVVLTVMPQWTIWFIGLFTLVNAGFLAASVLFSARDALRA